MKTTFTVDRRAGLVSVKKKDVPIVVRELKRIEQESGVITPANVLREASRSRSPLRRFFTWDNDVAAQKYREWQARILIGCVQVTITNNGESQTVRAFVSVSPQKEDENEEFSVPDAGYASVDNVSMNGGYRKQVERYAYNQLMAWRKKFGGFKKFFAVAEAIDSIK